MFKNFLVSILPQILLAFVFLVLMAVVLPVLGPVPSSADTSIGTNCFLNDNKTGQCKADLLFHQFSSADECKAVAADGERIRQLVGTMDACPPPLGKNGTAVCQMGIASCNIDKPGSSCFVQVAIPNCSVAQFDSITNTGSWGGAVGSNCSGCNPPPPATHKTCQNNACVVVEGAGHDGCSQNSDCAPATHKACVSNACATVSGAGANSCQSDTDCAPQTHKACVNNACALVEGAGTNSCNLDTDCAHKECRKNACTLVSGAGQNACATDTDCAPQTHRECRSQACVVVSGSGSNQCNVDGDCVTANHNECQNNACVTVSGAGASTCTTNSQCQPANQSAICDSLSVSPSSGNTPLTVNAVLSGHTVNGGSITNYKFNFGDGTGNMVQSGQILSHTFSAVGNFTINGFVIDNLGNQSGGSGNCQKLVATGSQVLGAVAPPTIPKTGPETAVLLGLVGSGVAGWMLKRLGLDK